ncbi:MAG: hydrogenase maturation protease [Candidatus Zixiibacteriota bacterium]
MNDYSQIVIVGFGNEFRKDDGLGLYVARRLKNEMPGGINIVEGIHDGYALLNTWDKSSTVFIIDCAVSGKKPGTIYRFDALHEKIPSDLFDGFSTHTISLIDAIELADILEKLPEGLFVYGVEGKDYSTGVGLTPEIQISADQLAEDILSEIKSMVNW